MLHIIYGIDLLVRSVSGRNTWLAGSKERGNYVTVETTREEGNLYNDHYRSSWPTSNTNSVFYGLFDLNGKLDERRFTQIRHKLHRLKLHELTALRDLDHYNLFDKAAIYNSVELMRFLLSTIPGDYKSAFVSLYLQESFHMACLLGCFDIVKLLNERFPFLSRAKGRVIVRTLIGSPEHGLKPLVSGTSPTEATPSGDIVLQWVQNHHDELAAYFATCNNQLSVVEYLVEQMLKEEVYNVETIEELFAVACSSGALTCIKYFSGLLPEGVNTRDTKGWAIIEKGLSHGLAYIRTLADCGLKKDIINNLNGPEDLNALHVVYSNLTRQNWSYSRCKEVYEATKCLVELGVDVNQETSVFSHNGVRETALGLLLDRLNLIVDTKTIASHVPMQNRMDFQRAFDEDMIKSVALILSAGFNLEKHGTRVILKLFSNHKHFLRFNIANVHPQLQNAAYGLNNTLSVTRMLFNKGIRMTFTKGDTTPLLAVLNGFLMPVSPFDALGDSTFAEAFKSCIQILLENKVDPNSYPLSIRNQHLPPLIRLLELYVTQWADHASVDNSVADDPCLDTICDIISMFTDAGADFTCCVNLYGLEFISRGVFDHLYSTLIHNPPTKSPVHISRSINLIERITTLLINKGAFPRLYEYAVYATGLKAIDSGLRLSLLYQWVYAGVVLNDPLTDNVLGNPQYHALLQLLLNLADHDVFYSVLTAGLREILHLHSDKVDLEHQTLKTFLGRLREMGSTVRGLKHACRINLNQYVLPQASIASLPLPPEIHRYISDFALC